MRQLANRQTLIPGFGDAGQVGAAPSAAGVALDAAQGHRFAVQGVEPQQVGGLANTDETLVLMNMYPLESAGFAGRLQSDNPMFVDAIGKLNP